MLLQSLLKVSGPLQLEQIGRITTGDRIDLKKLAKIMFGIEIPGVQEWKWLYEHLSRSAPVKWAL